MVRTAVPVYVYIHSAQQSFHIQISLNTSLQYVIVLCDYRRGKVCGSVSFIFYFHKALQKHVWQPHPVVLSSGGT